MEGVSINHYHRSGASHIWRWSNPLRHQLIIGSTEHYDHRKIMQASIVPASVRVMENVHEQCTNI
jgi:hypothetical protein